MKKNNISSLPHNECCGCRICADVCPKECISFIEDSEGFFYPQVNEDLCISCGKCIRACPEIKPTYNPKANIVTAAYAEIKSDRNAGSSGGIFGLLAKAILRSGGNVWGAAFDENLKLKHRCASSLSELPPLLKSKYLQSDTSYCFKAILNDLRDDKLVLFSGTPCQCNAIKNIAGKYQDKLITVEVVCHGVPSQSLFDKCIKNIEERDKCKITSFSFRAKYKGALHPQAFSYVCNKNGNDKTIKGLHYQFPFYFGFQKYITLRPSCYSCKWACPERTADITLSDFWGIEKYNPSLNAKQGVSAVILNTDKGVDLFNKALQKENIWCEILPIEAAIENNGCLKSPTPLKKEREDFFTALRTKPFDEVVDSFLTSKKQWIFDIYYGMPGFLRRIIRKVMDKRMNYE